LPRPELPALELLAIASLLGLGLSLLVGRFARAIGTSLNLLDHPDSAGGRKQHRRVTPLVGGIAVAGAALAAMMLVRGTTADAALALDMGWLALAVGVMFMIGAVDDRRNLNPYLRLGAAVAILSLVVIAAPHFSLDSLLFSGEVDAAAMGNFGPLFALLCLVGLLNAVNMADGKNGVVIGMGLIWTVLLALHAPVALLPVLAATGVALAVMLGFNMANRLFLGDGGSYAVSTLFGLLAIAIYNIDADRLRADEVALLFAVPVFDTIRLMATRLMQGRSPMEGDRDHLHHHLHARIGWPRGLLVYLTMVAAPNFAALIWPGSGLVWLAVTFLAYLGVLVATRYSAASRPAE
jgi:UDP-GlcNAc:undecaprenyl-phosphate GlcNAc-1-phosphate transferase